MKTAESKITSNAGHLQQKMNGPFFNKGMEGSFFSKSHKGTGSFFNATSIQAKLNIGQPNDIYEKEANAMADKVVQRLSGPSSIQTKSNSIGSVTSFVQKKCSHCEEEEKLQKKEKEKDNFLNGKLQMKPIFESNAEPPDDEKNVQRKCAECEKEEKLQKKSENSSESAPSNIESSLNSSKGAGSSLPTATREQMENSFGADFSNVRIHNYSSSIQMSKDLNAQAFTHGRDIYFNQGKYDPDSTGGKHLLAHELTHVIQQGKPLKAKSATAPVIQRLGDITQVPPGMSCAIANSSPGGVTEITFATSSSAISRSQQVMLNGFVRGWHAGGGNMNIRLDGYASTDGPDALNWNLSCARANAVKSHLENPSDGSPGISPGLMEIFAQGETNEFGNNLAANRKVIISSVARPVPPPPFRTERTDFGTYDVYPDAFIGPMLPNQLREAELQRLRTAWDRMVANTGGMITNGTDADRQSLRNIFGREIPRSMTFRNLFLEIVEDRARPVIINVGRNNAFWGDAFATNAVDLNDLEMAPADPVAGYEWVHTQGERTIHWLSERRFAAVNGRANFGPAHQHPLQAGGDQENYRRDIGQTGRIVSQTSNNLGGGLVDMDYTDSNGNIVRYRTDNSGGNPTTYEIVYQPAAGAAVAPHTRTNSMHAQVNSNAGVTENLYVRYSAAGRTVNTAPLPIDAGNSQQFDAALRNLVPAGATIQVRIFRRNAVGADTQIALLNWAHPFDTANTQVNAGATIYNLNVSLQMSN